MHYFLTKLLLCEIFKNELPHLLPAVPHLYFEYRAGSKKHWKRVMTS